jgi:hypothetical protein
MTAQLSKLDRETTGLKVFPLFTLMGWVLIGFSILVGILVLGPTAASYWGGNANAIFFSASKATREAAEAGSVLVAANVLRHSLPTWVPSFKFLGLGIMLGAITMALGLIATTLRDLGKDVTSLWPDELNPGVPQKPRSAKLFPMLMMMGWMLLLIGLIVALWLNGTVTSYWNHSIVNVLNPAGAGSALLNQLGLITGTLPWLGFLRFAGMALLFTSITVALTVIIRTLQTQKNLLNKFVQARSGGN